MAAKLTRLTHKIAIQLYLEAELYYLQLSLHAASPQTFRYTLVKIQFVDSLKHAIIPARPQILNPKYFTVHKQECSSKHILVLRLQDKFSSYQNHVSRILDYR